MKFVDLKAQYNAYKDEIDQAMQEVIDTTAFINGPAVKDLEQDLSEFCEAKHAIACSSGTDALLIPLLAMDIQPGDEIIVPAFTYIATASMVALLKAVPVFVDVDPVTFCMDPKMIEKKIGIRTKGIIPVSLFGQMANLEAIRKIADIYKLFVMEDGAQSFGATRNGDYSCSCRHTELAITSFFPAKPLGCYGDGGAIFTNDDALAENIRMIVNHGQEKRYHHAVIGMNGRIDTLQAAITRVKLRHFTDELEKRNAAAAQYERDLDGTLIVKPKLDDANSSSWAQYTIRVDNRDTIREKLQEQGIPTAVHYPLPLPRQKAFKELPQCKMSEVFLTAENLSQSVLSLPMHAFLTREEQKQITDTVNKTVQETNNA